MHETPTIRFDLCDDCASDQEGDVCRKCALKLRLALMAARWVQAAEHLRHWIETAEVELANKNAIMRALDPLISTELDGDNIPEVAIVSSMADRVTKLLVECAEAHDGIGCGCGLRTPPEVLK